MKDLQQKIKKFCQDNKLISPPEHHALDVVSELGEVAKEILKMTDYGRKPFVFREEIKSELGDLTYSLIALANSMDIDLEVSVIDVLKKYEKRFHKGSADSEND